MNDIASTRPISRRGVLRTALGAGIALGAGPLVSACSGSDDGSAGSGSLRIGILGAGKGESLNPSRTASALINIALCGAVYDSLTRIAPDLSLQPGLAADWKMAGSANEWTVRLREGVTWHDGDPFTADDVIYTLRWTGRKGNQLAEYVSSVDLSGLRAVDKYTVIVPMRQPHLQLMHDLAVVPIIKAGVDTFERPVGTGPFVFESFDPGQRGVFTRNGSYWIDGKPRVERLEILSITDDTARLNALMGGQIDAMAQVPLSQAKSIESRGLKLLDSPSTAAHAFCMAVDEEPFSDVRVRQAIRLLADREELVDVGLNGFGMVANDLYGEGLPYYAESLPQREQDVSRAKRLLAQAGYGSGLTITLESSTVVPGMAEAAALLQQQAEEGGVHIEIANVDPAAYWDPTQKYLKMPFCQTYWAGSTGIGDFYTLALLPDGAGNETHWSNETTSQRIRAATTATESGEARRLWSQVQREQYERGGYLWWGNASNVDATSPYVSGITPSMYYPLGLPWSLADARIDA